MQSAKENLDERLGVRFPASWARYSLEDVTDWMGGVEILETTDWAWSGERLLEIGFNDDGDPLVLKLKGRSVLEGVYCERSGRLKKVADSLWDLAAFASSPTAQEKAFWDLSGWTAYLAGRIKVCADCGREVYFPSTCVCTRPAQIDDVTIVRSEEDLKEAGVRWPRLLPAFALAQKLVELGWTPLGSADEIQVLAGCHQWPGSDADRLDRLRDRWEAKYGYAAEDLPSDLLLAFLATAP